MLFRGVGEEGEPGFNFNQPALGGVKIKDHMDRRVIAETLNLLAQDGPPFGEETGR